MLINQKISKPATRSFVVDEEMWEAAKIKAEKDGLKISEVLRMLVDGYRRGHYELPTVKTTVTY